MTLATGNFSAAGNDLLATRPWDSVTGDARGTTAGDFGKATPGGGGWTVPIWSTQVRNQTTSTANINEYHRDTDLESPMSWFQ